MWLTVDLSTDPDEPEYRGDPADLVDPLADLLRRPAWHAHAACADHPHLDWFDPTDVDTPRAVCDGCPVRRDCLNHALDLPERHGMWGGLTPNERRKLR